MGKISQILLKSEPTDDSHVVSQSYADSLSENNTNRRDLSTVFNGQGKEFDINRLTILDSITANRDWLQITNYQRKNLSMTQ